ncbi:MAG: nucleotide exchange factor GrpE [Sedimentibacter sp.]|uniref:nucleotide exchange factor GrpE n=1 Tax=Sedimentibacter sp. TaxID=1960295 RepID=UPI00298189A0|nr:nucleotide exchange factor GrpE [Sedimentibacter sp.]MDW5298691.1 nucleotide exchange factor GrpE [Sedimentibacter sp.]
MAKAKKRDEEKLNENVAQDKDILNEAKEANEEISEENKVEETENSKDSKSSEEEVLNNKLLRLQADFLNYKNRTEKEKISTYGNAMSDIILELLPVVDNLERAIDADKSETDNFKQGVQMVYTQLAGILNKKGLKEVDALHKQFDHNVHYGVAFEACDDYEDGTIIDVLQKGYTFNDKLLRPAMVRICKK